MKHNLSLARFSSVLIAVALLTAACAPIPLYPPRLTPTASVFLPGLQAPNPGMSPLQPTSIASAAVANGAVVTATVAPSPTAASAAATAVPSPTPFATLAGPVWQWVSSTFKDGTVLAPSDPSRYTLQLVGDGNGLVQADCNFGSATYEESNGSVSFSAIGTTKVACPPDSLDSAFIAQLRNSASYAFEAGELVITLKDQAGTMRLRIAPSQAGVESASPTAELLASPTPVPTDTPWPPTEVPTALPATPTLVPPATPARVLIATPTSVPSAIPTTVPLPTPTNVPLATSTPPLPGTPVPVPTVLVAATTQLTLNGTSWLLVSLTANNQAIPPIGTTPVTLEIDPDGTRVSGSTGCNLYRATLGRNAAGTAIAGPALMTQKACAASLMVQEVEFIDSLLRARQYIVRGNELTLLDARGNTLLVFARK